MDISVIIVNWHSKAYVRQCLTSLYRYCRSTPFEVIVVDGASFDGCGEMLAAEFPRVRFVQSTTNVGFARANNLGVRHAKGQFLLFLNPDTELQEDSVQILVEALRALPNAAAVGCRLLNSDRTLQTSCVQSFPTVLNQVLDAEFLRERIPDSKLWGISALYATSQRPAPVEVISGACILVHRGAFEAVDGFTESYFMYGEDLDLCFKLQKRCGRIYYVPATSIVHFGGGSTAKAASEFSNVMMRSSVHHFLRLNHGGLSAFAYRASMAVNASARLLVIGPMMVFGRSVVRHGSGSWRKWSAILQWSLGVSPRSPVRAAAVSPELTGTKQEAESTKL